MYKFFACACCLGILLILYSAAYSQNANTRGTTPKGTATDSTSGKGLPVKKELKAVEVVGRKNYIEYQLDKTVINVDGLISSAGGNVVDILNNAPGVLVDENGSISLRGKEGVVVYVDNRPLQLSGTDLLNYLKSLPAGTIDKIELMTNPSARYNADGAAVINIKTKKIKARGLNGSISPDIGFGRYFRSNNSLLLNYKTDKINVFLNTGFSTINQYFLGDRQRHYSYADATPSYTLLQHVHEISHQLSSNYRFGIDYDISRVTTVGILVDGYANPYREKGNYINRFIDPSNKEDSSLISNSWFKNKPYRNSVNVNLRHLFDGLRKEINVNLDYLNFSTRSNQTLEGDLYHPVDSFVNQSVMFTENSFHADIYSAKADFSDTIFNSIKMEQGVQTIYSIRNSAANYSTQSGNILISDQLLNNRFRYKENISAAYINFQRDFKRLSVQAGLRMESTAGNALQFDMATKPDTSFSLHYTNLFPTVYLMYKTDSSGKKVITLSMGRRIERPGYNDLNPSSFYFDRNTSITGNKLLQPAYTTSFEGAYNYNGKFSAGLSYNKTKGLITGGFKQVGNAFISMPVNVSDYTLWNTSINWTINVTRWWVLNIDQELENRHYQGKSFDDGPYINQRLTTFLLKTYSRFSFKKGWSADLTTTYRSKLLTWQSDLRARAIAYAGVQKKINEKATITFSAQDIFHTQIVRRDINIPYAQVYYYLVFDTQRVNITFRYRFGKSVSTRERKTGIETEAGRVN
jgi:hypothetical protein